MNQRHLCSLLTVLMSEIFYKKNEILKWNKQCSFKILCFWHVRILALSFVCLPFCEGGAWVGSEFLGVGLVLSGGPWWDLKQTNKKKKTTIHGT